MRTFPPREIKSDGAEDPGAEYDFSVTVRIVLSDKDSFGRRFYPDGEADAYYDFDDGRWHWSDLSGGPHIEPKSWSFIK